ncbi:MAG: hypothetical protein ACP5FX_01015 [Candidatus Micrarchaeia archaeon]
MEKKSFLLNRVYAKIIERYKKQIEEMEVKSIADLPLLITPKDEKVEELKREIIKKVEERSGEVYSFNLHFLEAAKEAIKIINSFETVSLPLEFWFLPKEVIELRAGDLVDKAILLCSLLISLGNEGAKVLMKIEPQKEKREAYVTFDFNGESYVFDISKKALRKTKKEKICKGAVVYEFNDKGYSELEL